MDKYTSALLGIDGGQAQLGIVDEAIDIFNSIADKLYTDGIFIRYRDKVFAIIFANFPRSVYDPILAEFKLGHRDIPDRKIGKNYAPEFERLHQAVAKLLDTKKPGLGSVFLAKSTEFAQKYLAADPSRSYKGAPDEALTWVLANPNATVSSYANNTLPTSQSPGEPDVAEASFNIAPNTRMLLIAGGVLLLGGVTFLIARNTAEKKDVGNLDGKKKKLGTLQVLDGVRGKKKRSTPMKKVA